MNQASRAVICLYGGFFVFIGNPMATDEVKRKLTAIFSADVVGYSRLMGEDELTTVEGFIKRLPIIIQAQKDLLTDGLRKAGLK